MIEAKKLPYDLEDLSPFISKETLFFHYEKHYKGYVNKLNELINGSDFENHQLKDIILRAGADTLYTPIFNNAAQVFNHEFYFDSLTDQEEKKQASAFLIARIEKDFGSLKKLKETLIQKGLSLFGSGYVWLVEEEWVLKVVTTSNAFTPVTRADQKPLLAIDVWEHAYYLDRQNLRADYLSQVVENCLNFAFVEENLKRIKE